MVQKLPDFSIEVELWERGYSHVIGVDEVGRGALAGPVVAAAAALRIQNLEFRIQNYILNLGINDSKKLMAKERERLDKEICKFFQVGIGEASVMEINKYGIVKATEKAMRRSIKDLRFKIYDLRIHTSYFLYPKSFLLVDAFHVKYIPGVGLRNQKAIIGGDGKSISIAAAAIVAKVYRDRLMANLGRNFRHYGWRQNKGYGTKVHQEGIRKNGLCEYHRIQFVDHLVKFHMPQDYP